MDYIKDLNKNGRLDKYEDWRLPIDERAKDLAEKMSVEQISGLMLYSSHQSIPAADSGFGTGHYKGKVFTKSGAKPWSLTNEQIKFLTEDYVRHVLIAHLENPEVVAKWNNEAQALIEGTGLGIPANNSSDPRHTPSSNAEFAIGSKGLLSMWPRELGMAATFDSELTRTFGEITSAEYRAMGITTALSPQADLGTEPRWFRFGMTFGEQTQLVTDMTKAYIDGFQTSTGSDEVENGWGYSSVNTMVKHWPGGGTGEGGRDAHWAYGKFAVYPGKNFDEHLIIESFDIHPYDIVVYLLIFGITDGFSVQTFQMCSEIQVLSFYFPCLILSHNMFFFRQVSGITSPVIGIIACDRDLFHIVQQLEKIPVTPFAVMPGYYDSRSFIHGIPSPSLITLISYKTPEFIGFCTVCNDNFQLL